MQKLRLNFEALAVESFPTTRETCATEGTIHAHEADISGIPCTTLLTKPTRCPCTPRDADFY